VIAFLSRPAPAPGGLLGPIAHGDLGTGFEPGPAPARAFLVEPADGEHWSVAIEGLGREQESTIPTVALRLGTHEIQAQAMLTRMGEDLDGNGMEEVVATFGAADLAILAAAGPATGGRANAEVDVNAGTAHAFGAPVAIETETPAPAASFTARLSPDPIRTQGVLSFTTTRAEAVRVTLYDVEGRRVGTLLDDPLEPAGRHTLTIEGSGTRATHGSGLYFYRIETKEGTIDGHFALIR